MYKTANPLDGTRGILRVTGNGEPIGRDKDRNIEIKLNYYI
jgi:hypothetical protein